MSFTKTKPLDYLIQFFCTTKVTHKLRLSQAISDSFQALSQAPVEFNEFSEGILTASLPNAPAK
jgi:hypothetical protein